jgi:hypothetical protein
LIRRIDDAIVVVRKESTMIDGLKVTLTGEDLSVWSGALMC